MSRVVAPAGRIAGTQGDGVRVFRGIPYGRPPVGSLRWRPPEPAPPGDIDATRPGPIPPQTVRPRPDWAPPPGDAPMGEDCLNLDLIAPPPGGPPAPVIVHAFGGGFQGGGAAGGWIDGPAFVRATGCLLVRPNMRTGALGFLHLGEHFPELAETNRGLLDLALAIDWVRRNAEAFGGDPDRICVSGMSSGAFTATALFGMAEPPPVRAGWMMSGAASRIVRPDTAAAIAEDFLHATGVRPGDLPALEALPVEAILAAQEAGLATDLGERNAPGGRTLGIVLDGTSLVRHPLEALKAGAGRRAALVFGATAQEARMWYAAGIMGTADEARLLATIRRFDGAEAEATLAALREGHPDDGPTALEERFLTERIYTAPARASAEAQRSGGGAGWSYAFTLAPPPPHDALGASHGFDEPFAFGSLARAAALWGHDAHARRIAGEMCVSLAALARDGEPGWSCQRTFE